MSPLYIITLPPMKKWSDLNKKRNLHRSSTVYKPLNSSKQICGCILMGETTGDGLCHWRKCYYGSCTLILVGSNGLNLKTSWWICFLQTDKMLTDGLKWCGLLWCFYQLFGLSFWRHPFTTKDPLARKRWNDTFLQVWWRNKLNYILDGLRLWKFSFFFLVIYSFKDTTSQKLDICSLPYYLKIIVKLH